MYSTWVFGLAFVLNDKWLKTILLYVNNKTAAPSSNCVRVDGFKGATHDLERTSNVWRSPHRSPSRRDSTYLLNLPLN